MKPKEVNEENKYKVWLRLFGHLVSIEKPKYEIGDKVRVIHLNTLYRRTQLKLGQHQSLKIRDEAKKTFGDFFREKYKKNDPEDLVRQDAHNLDRKRPPFSTEIFSISKVLLGDPNVYKLYSEEFNREVLGIFYKEELSLVK